MQNNLKAYNEKFIELEIKGKGKSGSARLVKNKKDGKNYISKIIKLNQMTSHEQKQALQEIEILQKLHHPNIVKFYEHYVQPDQELIIIMEYCKKGDLQSYLEELKDKNDYLQEQEVMNYFVQLILALEYIHNRKILHRDIKTSNILLCESGFIKIGDFGISKMLDNTSEICKTFIGTPYYLAPELVEEQKYSQKADVWSIGVVLYELTSRGEHPFQGNSLMALLQKITSQVVTRISYRYSQQLDNLVQALLTKNPAKRPSAREVLVNPIIIIQLRQFMVQKNTNANNTNNTNNDFKQNNRSNSNSKQNNRVNVDKGRVSLEQKIYQNKLVRENKIVAENINLKITQLKQQAKDDFRKFKEQKKQQIDKYNKIFNGMNNAVQVERNQEINVQKAEDDLMGQTIQSLDYSDIKNQLSQKKNDLSTKIQNINLQDETIISQPLNQSYQQVQTDRVQQQQQEPNNMSKTIDIHYSQVLSQQSNQDNQSQQNSQQNQLQKSIQQSQYQSQNQSQHQYDEQQQNQQDNQSQHQSQHQSQDQQDNQSQVVKTQELSEQQLLELDYENKHNDTATLERLSDSIIRYQQELEQSLPKTQSKLTATQKSNISFNLSLTQDSIIQIQNQMTRSIPKTTKGSGDSDSTNSFNNRDSGEFNEIYGCQLMDSLKKSQGFNRHLIMKKELSDIQEDTLELQFTPGGKNAKVIDFGQNSLKQPNLY